MIQRIWIAYDDTFKEDFKAALRVEQFCFLTGVCRVNVLDRASPFYLNAHQQLLLDAAIPLTWQSTSRVHLFEPSLQCLSIPIRKVDIINKLRDVLAPSVARA